MFGKLPLDGVFRTCVCENYSDVPALLCLPLWCAHRIAVCRTVKGAEGQSARPGVRRDGRGGRRLGVLLLGGQLDGHQPVGRLREHLDARGVEPPAALAVVDPALLGARHDAHLEQVVDDGAPHREVGVPERLRGVWRRRDVLGQDGHARRGLGLAALVIHLRHLGVDELAARLEVLGLDEARGVVAPRLLARRLELVELGLEVAVLARGLARGVDALGDVGSREEALDAALDDRVEQPRDDAHRPCGGVALDARVVLVVRAHVAAVAPALDVERVPAHPASEDARADVLAGLGRLRGHAVSGCPQLLLSAPPRLVVDDLLPRAAHVLAGVLVDVELGVPLGRAVAEAPRLRGRRVADVPCVLRVPEHERHRRRVPRLRVVDLGLLGVYPSQRLDVDGSVGVALVELEHLRVRRPRQAGHVAEPRLPLAGERPRDGVERVPLEVGAVDAPHGLGLLGDDAGDLQHAVVVEEQLAPEPRGAASGEEPPGACARLVGGDLPLALVVDLELREHAADGGDHAVLGRVGADDAALGVRERDPAAARHVEPPLELALLAGEAVDVPHDDGVHLAGEHRRAEQVVLGALDVELRRRDGVVGGLRDDVPPVGRGPFPAVVLLPLDALLALRVVERDARVDRRSDGFALRICSCV